MQDLKILHQISSLLTLYYAPCKMFCSHGFYLLELLVKKYNLRDIASSEDSQQFLQDDRTI